MRGNLGEALGRSGLHDQQDALGVRKALTRVAEVVLGMNGDMIALVQGVVVDGMLVHEVLGDIIVDVLFVGGG